MTSGRSMEEPLEEHLKPAKKQLRSAKVACEEAHTVETNAKSFILNNNENERPTSDASSKGDSKAPAASKRAALLPLAAAISLPLQQQQQQPLQPVDKVPTIENWANLQIPPIPCLNPGDAHLTKQAAHLLRSPPNHDSDQGQFFVGSSVEENRSYRPYMEDRSYATVYNGAAFLGLYDGHAGSGAATFLEQNLLPTILSGLTPGADINTAMCAAYLDCNAALEASGCQHGSTATTVVMIGSRLVAANVGDSPALVVTSSGAVHNLIEEHKIEGGELTRVLELGVQVRQSNGPRYMSSADGTRWLNMSRAFGDWGYPGVICKPYVCTLDVSDAKYLILGSDGLTERWSLSSVAAHVKEFMQSHATPPPLPPPQQQQQRRQTAESRPSRPTSGDESSPPPADAGGADTAAVAADPGSREAGQALAPGTGGAAGSGSGGAPAPSRTVSAVSNPHGGGQTEGAQPPPPQPQQHSSAGKDGSDCRGGGEGPCGSDDPGENDVCRDQQAAAGKQEGVRHRKQQARNAACRRQQERQQSGPQQQQQQQQEEQKQDPEQQQRELQRQRQEEEDELDLRRGRKIRADVQQLARELVQQAVLSGSTDNITVVVMDVQEYLRQHSSRFTHLSTATGATATATDAEEYACGALARGWARTHTAGVDPECDSPPPRQSGGCNAHRVHISPTSD
ncbi:MAG: hypothetical protein WDW36_000996 [Sanguina aurantia]